MQVVRSKKNERIHTRMQVVRVKQMSECTHTHTLTYVCRW